LCGKQPLPLLLLLLLLLVPHLEPKHHPTEANCDEAVVVVTPHKDTLLQQRKANCRQTQTGEACYTLMAIQWLEAQSSRHVAARQTTRAQI
jgi:hypothetical protein